MESSAFEDKKCADCLFIYSCVGGCAKKHLFSKPNCTLIKENPEEFLECYYELLKTNRTIKSLRKDDIEKRMTF